MNKKVGGEGKVEKKWKVEFEMENRWRGLEKKMFLKKKKKNYTTRPPFFTTPLPTPLFYKISLKSNKL